MLKPLLPDYMIPSYYVHFEKMPLNTNGKIDKKSLTPPTFNENHAEYVPPETETQKMLCTAAEKILSDFFEVGKIGIDDDLILLGGDSICAMNLLVECKSLPLSVPLRLHNDKVCGGGEGKNRHHLHHPAPARLDMDARQHPCQGERRHGMV